MKRLLAVHDISGVGKCSLTVCLPIISACNVECACMPTAFLSTHTGGFTGFTYRDLTDDLTAVAEHWKSLDLSIDAIYSGFLGSFRQIQIIMNSIELLKKENTLVIVDPVMADNGELYSVFDDDFPKEMRKLCEKADIIIPNITEAVLLLGEKFHEGPYTKEYIENLLIKLSMLGPKKIVLTGVYFDSEKLGAACYDAAENKIEYAMGDKIEGSYHGTGDIFGSVFCGAVLNGKTLLESAQLAVDFTIRAIKHTYAEKTDPKYGVHFEAELPFLVNALK